jgi:hypothetical protein
MTEVSVNIKHKDGLLVKDMCDYALAYMDEHNIKRRGVERVTKEILDKVNWMLDNPLKDGRY